MEYYTIIFMKHFYQVMCIDLLDFSNEDFAILSFLWRSTVFRQCKNESPLDFLEISVYLINNVDILYCTYAVVRGRYFF